MRIIGGRYKRTPLQGPPDDRTTRPLPDRVRESIFNMLAGHLAEGPSVLDLFAGTGAFGLEAISRGAGRAVLVERDRTIQRVLRANIARLGVEGACEVVQADALGPLALARCPSPVTIVMMDPPYRLARDGRAWGGVLRRASALAQRLTDDGYLLLRTPWPFFHDPAPQADAPARRRPAPPPPGERVIELSLDDGSLEGTDVDEIEALFDRIAAGEPAHDQPEAPPPERGSLVVDGAVGPETHDYGTTAVHWYQKASTT